MNWTAMYKCRMCSKVFSDQKTSDRETAELAVCDLAYHDDTNRESTIVVSEHIKHECEDGSYGFADFIGFYKGA